MYVVPLTLFKPENVHINPYRPYCVGRISKRTCDRRIKTVLYSTRVNKSPISEL